MKLKVKKAKIVKKEGAQPVGGAAIASRLQLNAPPPQPTGGTISLKATAWAFSAGCLCLAGLGLLVYMMFKHAEYLMNV
ncbi:MAG: hypothetical protein IIZ70_00480 [Kiritimatiellae bacterium]|nr:hypothetical protein [Kiritimatiellia bacterium]